MIARAFPYDRPCRFQKFEATETIVTTGTTIWKPGLRKEQICVVPLSKQKLQHINDVLAEAKLTKLPSVIGGNSRPRFP